jgi:hypothetical protein
MRTWLRHASLAGSLLAVPISVAAQDPAPAGSPATLSYVEGSVDLDQQGVGDPATAPTLLVEGDRLRIRDGRAEIVFADGSILHADRGTMLEWLGERHVRLLAGRVIVRVSAAAAAFVVDTPPGSVRLDPRGEYDVTLRDGAGELGLAVARGSAEVITASDRLLVRAGEFLNTDGSGRPAWRQFNSARFDEFSRWAYDRALGSTAAASSSYLPYELRSYGPMLDQYGRWDYVAPYGYVWYPSVAVAWRPYYHGRWRHTRYGWTWYGHDRWAWPTHHFGRWGFSVNAWFWIPAKVWGPAWVSWGFSSGYVGWCPLGWDGRPVIPFGPRHHIAPFHDPWRAWNVVPRGRFGDARPVQSWIVDGRTLPEASRAFVLQSAAPPSPVGRGYAVPRGSLSIAGAAQVPENSWAVPRGTAGAVRRPGGATRAASAAPTTGLTTPNMPLTTPTASPDSTPTQAPVGAEPRRGPDARASWERSEGTPGGVRSPRVERPPAQSSDDGAEQRWSRRDRQPSQSAPAQGARRRDDPPPQTYSPPPSRGDGGSAQGYGAGRGGARNPQNGGASRDGPGRQAGSSPGAGTSAERSGGARSNGAVRRPR